MKVEVREIYLKMISAITQADELDLSEKALAEKKLLICFFSWEGVKALGKNFNTSEEEIDFFRNTKPAFTCLIDYYSLVKEALLHAPADSTLKWAYWNKELGRYARFCDRYKEFIDYYERGDHTNDRQYFLTSHYVSKENAATSIYDSDSAWRTNGDRPISRLKTLIHYREFITGKIRKLSREITP